MSYKYNNTKLRTPSGRKRTLNPYRTFETSDNHHNIYDIITQNIINFYDYLLKELQQKNYTYINKYKQKREEYWYINIIQKPISYDGIIPNNNIVNDLRGDLIIEFINNTKINYLKNQSKIKWKNKKIKKSNEEIQNMIQDYISTYLYHTLNIDEFHLTLHKYSSVRNKLHFIYKPHQYPKKRIDLQIINNKIVFKNKENNSDINKISLVILDIINKFISEEIKKNKIVDILSRKKEVVNTKFGMNLTNQFNRLVNNKNNLKNTSSNKKSIKKTNFENGEVRSNLENGEVRSNLENGEVGNNQILNIQSPLKKQKIKNQFGGYNKLTKDNLITICKKNKIKGYSNLKKELLIKLIINNSKKLINTNS